MARCNRCVRPASAGFKSCEPCRDRERARSARRWTYPEYRRQRIAAESLRRQTDEAFRQRKNAYARARSRALLSDPATRPAELARMRATIAELRRRPEWREKWAAYWRSEHGREVRRGLNNRRRARLLSVESRVSLTERREILLRANGECAYCGTAGPLTLDHYFPLALGGLDVASNLIPACLSCNSQKWKLHPSEWLARCSPDVFGRLSRMVA